MALVDPKAVGLAFDVVAGVVQHQRQAEGQNIAQALPQPAQAETAAVFAAKQQPAGQRHRRAAQRDGGKAFFHCKGGGDFEQQHRQRRHQHAGSQLQRGIGQRLLAALAQAHLGGEQGLRAGGQHGKGQYRRMPQPCRRQPDQRGGGGVAVAGRHHIGQVAAAVEIKITGNCAVLAHAGGNQPQREYRQPIRQLAETRRPEASGQVGNQQKGQRFGKQLARQINQAVFKNFHRIAGKAA